MKSFKLTFLIIIVFLFVGCSNVHVEGSIGDTISEKIVIHYIDVGQGDSTFIELPNHQTMLIDAGESQYGSGVVSYIQNLGIQKIDYILATHPHSDHIGGLKQIVHTFDIGNIYMPKAISTSSTYLNLLKAIDSKGLSIIDTKAPMNLLTTEDLQIDVLAPNATDYVNLNNYSIVLKIRYKNKSFLFTGDAEGLSEEEILKHQYDVVSDVVKVGHHGSDTSSGQKFVEQVQAKYAVVSVGQDNSYHHPNKNILKRWENSGAEVYRTDLLGNIIVESDGQTIEVNCSQSNDMIEETREELNIQVLDFPTSIQRGNTVTLSVLGVANTHYSIQVFYKSGVSSASGLEDKVSDSEGRVAWTWKVAGNVSVGTYKIIISDGKKEKIIDYEITK